MRGSHTVGNGSWGRRWGQYKYKYIHRIVNIIFVTPQDRLRCTLMIPFRCVFVVRHQCSRIYFNLDLPSFDRIASKTNMYADAQQQQPQQQLLKSRVYCNWFTRAYSLICLLRTRDMTAQHARTHARRTDTQPRLPGVKLKFKLPHTVARLLVLHRVSHSCIKSALWVGISICDMLLCT